MSSTSQQPVLFLSHGGGPSFFLDAKSFPNFKGLDKDSRAASFLRNLVQHVRIKKPSVILVFSAHWAERTCSVTSGATTSLYYDYGGFPPETYKLEWKPPGARGVASKVVALLAKHGIRCTENTSRGLDHGVFVPLKLVFPKADIPVLQVSLLSSLDICDNMKIAEALTELRQDNVLVIGSGFGTHAGMRDSSPATWALEFQTLIHDIVTNTSYTSEERKSKLLNLVKEDCFKKAHSPPDHFLPIAMCMAVTGYNPGKILLSEFVAGSLMNDHYMFE